MIVPAHLAGRVLAAFWSHDGPAVASMQHALTAHLGELQSVPTTLDPTVAAAVADAVTDHVAAAVADAVTDHVVAAVATLIADGQPVTDDHVAEADGIVDRIRARLTQGLDR